MNTADIFAAGLGLTDPWYVTNVEFRPSDDEKGESELHISVDFRRGAKFTFQDSEGNILCDADGAPLELKANDTVERTWRHLNFFQYKTFLHARVPKARYNGKTPTARVPWARKNTGFTLLFEAMVLEYVKHMTVAVLARLVGENDKRLWTIILHYVSEALKLVDMSKVEMIGMDETSKKGHNYITVVVDLKTHNVLFVTDGKDSSTIDAFVKDFVAHKGDPDKIKIITCDMSLGFEKGVNAHFSNADTIIDKFHVIKHANEAVDTVRKEEVKTNSLLKKTKYLWLKNECNLTESQLKKKKSLSSKHLKTARAYAQKVELQDIYETCTDRAAAESRLKKLCSWLMRSRLEPMKKFCGTLKNHWDEILNYFDNRFTNAVLEGTNSVIQNIKTRARGFRNDEYLKAMIYLILGDLPMEDVLKMAATL